MQTLKEGSVLAQRITTSTIRTTKVGKEHFRLNISLVKKSQEDGEQQGLLLSGLSLEPNNSLVLYN